MTIKKVLFGLAAVAGVALPGVASAQPYGYHGGYSGDYYGRPAYAYGYDRHRDYDRFEHRRWEERRRWEEARREWRREHRWHDHDWRY